METDYNNFHGTRNAFAVFLIAVIEEFGWSRGLAFGRAHAWLGYVDVRRADHRDSS